MGATLHTVDMPLQPTLNVVERYCVTKHASCSQISILSLKKSPYSVGSSSSISQKLYFLTTLHDHKAIRKQKKYLWPSKPNFISVMASEGKIFATHALLLGGDSAQDYQSRKKRKNKIKICKKKYCFQC